MSETREEKIKKAWNNYYSVSNSEGMRCGNMTCHKCKEKIEGDYLIQNRSNWMHRGNETDECYLFHRKCSESNKAWEKKKKKQKEHQEANLIRENQIKEVKSLMRKYGLDADDLFDTDY